VIGELPEKERQVLALYYFEELTMKEVGRHWAWANRAVSQIHSLAIVRLRARLSEMQARNPRLRAVLRRPQPRRWTFDVRRLRRGKSS